ncbi:MAG: helix-turn-helix domain-containing protein [Lachnospiraceae bacterium]|nr:helix-turn-helix domain-containing protein [Lachnospiraceae bacterium]
MDASEKIRRKRYEQMDRICYSVCIGNEFQTLRAVRERNKLGIPGRLPEPLTEWKYDLIWQEALIAQSLREIGVPEASLDEVCTEFTGRIYRATGLLECRRISEEMAVRFCRMNSLKEIQRYSALVQTILQTIDKDLSQPLTLQHFSQTLNVNSSYLSALFSREVGMPLTEYVTAQRISYAADLLLTTQNPIKTIAKLVGIPDVQYFSRLFKKRTGQTPSQYRMRSQRATAEE